MGSCTLSQASATLLPQALPRVARAGGAGCRRGQGDGIGVIAAHSLQGSIKKLGEIVAVINLNSTHTNLMPVSCPPSCAGPLRAVSCGEGVARADTPSSGIWSTFRVNFFAQGAITGYSWPISPMFRPRYCSPIVRAQGACGRTRVAIRSLRRRRGAAVKLQATLLGARDILRYKQVT